MKCLVIRKREIKNNLRKVTINLGNKYVHVKCLVINKHKNNITYKALPIYYISKSRKKLQKLTTYFIN